MSPSTKTLYFDESGFTGSNLLDPLQPILTIASTDLIEAESEKILRDSFPRYRGNEFKFSEIWGSSNAKGLVRFAEQMAQLSNHSYVWMIDKRFAVLTKITDFLIEPFFTKSGHDFYDDGFCWKYCNYIYFGFMQFSPPSLFNSLTQAYQEFSRNPNEKSLWLLQSRLTIMANSAEESVQVFLQQMASGARLFHAFNDLATFKGSDELQLTSMVALVADWRKQYPEDFIAIHDASSNFMRGRELWNKITNVNVPKQLHRLGDGSEVEYPLRVIETKSIDSKDNRSIQLCDILAGLTAKYFNPSLAEPHRELLNEVVKAGLDQIKYNGIRPQKIFPDYFPPKKLTGPDTVDQMVEIIKGAHNNLP